MLTQRSNDKKVVVCTRANKCALIRVWVLVCMGENVHMCVREEPWCHFSDTEHLFFGAKSILVLEFYQVHEAN